MTCATTSAGNAPISSIQITVDITLVLRDARPPKKFDIPIQPAEANARALDTNETDITPANLITLNCGTGNDKPVPNSNPRTADLTGLNPQPSPVPLLGNGKLHQDQSPARALLTPINDR